MKGKIIVLACITALFVCLPGCQKKQTDVGNWYVNTGEKMSDDDTEAEDSLAFDIQALYVDDENSVRSDITFVGITDSEYATHMLITVNQPITDFSLWEIEMAVNENGDYIGVEKNRIASTKEVTPEKSVLVTAELGEVLPTKGISFVDQEGNRRHYYLTLSGKDGSAIVAPYDITDTVETSSEAGS